MSEEPPAEAHDADEKLKGRAQEVWADVDPTWPERADVSEQKAADSAKRILDPNKAHAMALAGDQARTEARNWEEAAGVIGTPESKIFDEDKEARTARQRAERLESEAGNKYDERQAEVAESAKRILDPDKAHTMALAADDYRTSAAEGRTYANSIDVQPNDKLSEAHKNTVLQKSQMYDEHADIEEDAAGRKYDQEQGTKPNPTD